MRRPYRPGHEYLGNPSGNENPAVQVMTNSSPHREVIDALHELRVIVVQAIDKLASYLRNGQTPLPDGIRLISPDD
jgi:hypothetical protein